MVGRVLPADSKTQKSDIPYPQAVPRIARHNALGDVSAGKSRVAKMFLRCPSMESGQRLVTFSSVTHARVAVLHTGVLRLFVGHVRAVQSIQQAHVLSWTLLFCLCSFSNRSQKGYSAPAVLQTERHVWPFPRALPPSPMVKRWTPKALMRLLPSPADDAIAPAASVRVAASILLR